MGGLDLGDVKVYRNSDVLKVVAFVPPCHKHLRLVLVLRDQVLVLHEATVAAIARAYIDIVSHPTRKAVEYGQRILDKEHRKPGYAEHQLVDEVRTESEIIGEWGGLLGLSECRENTKSTSDELLSSSKT